jgi:hypothetical protein
MIFALYCFLSFIAGGSVAVAFCIGMAYRRPPPDAPLRDSFALPGSGDPRSLRALRRRQMRTGPRP